MKIHTRYLLRARVAAQREVGDHFLVGKFISFRALDHAIQYQDISIGLTADNSRNTVKKTNMFNGAANTQTLYLLKYFFLKR